MCEEEKPKLARLNWPIGALPQTFGSADHITNTVFALPGVLSIKIDEDFEGVGFTATVHGGLESAVW